jgi:putative PIN family toxin of toxin-antitoxin system
MPKDDLLSASGLRATVDTSVLIAFLWGHGPVCVRLLELWKARRFVLVTSLELIEELRVVAQRPKMRGHVDAAEAQALISALELDAAVVAGELAMPGATRDPKDDKVLACALEGEAEMVVTLDPDLLTLAEYRRVRIVNPVQFVAQFDD